MVKMERKWSRTSDTLYEFFVICTIQFLLFFNFIYVWFILNRTESSISQFLQKFESLNKKLKCKKQKLVDEVGFNF